MGKVITHIFAAYIGAGLFGALLMSASIPAMNWLGMFTYMSIWPRFIYCAPVARGCNPLDAFPQWAQALMFTL